MIHKDILYYHIIRYLSNKKIYSLFTNTELRNKLITENSIREIRFRLSKIFGKRYKIFRKFLEDGEVFISGSFIIQCILQVEWNDSDIDIYILPHHPIFNKSKKLNKDIATKNFDFSNFRELSEKELFYHEEFVAYIRNVNDNDDIFTNYIKLIYNVNNKIIKVMICHPYMNPKPSFDICDNYYSESGRHSRYPFGDEILFIKNIDSLFTKKMICFDINPGLNELNTTIRRYRKYKERGFKLDNDFKYFLNILDEYKSKSDMPLIIKIQNAPYDTRHTSNVFIFDPEEN